MDDLRKFIVQCSSMAKQNHIHRLLSRAFNKLPRRHEKIRLNDLRYLRLRADATLRQMTS